MQREATAMTVRQNLGELLNEVQYKHDEIVITKAGKPVAAIIDMASYEQFRRKNSGEFERAWADFAKGFEDLTQEQAETLARVAVAEAREEIRQGKAGKRAVAPAPRKPA